MVEAVGTAPTCCSFLIQIVSDYVFVITNYT